MRKSWFSIKDLENIFLEVFHFQEHEVQNLFYDSLLKTVPEQVMESATCVPSSGPPINHDHTIKQEFLGHKRESLCGLKGFRNPSTSSILTDT